ncbi:MAG TPA: hypothetical protein VK464_09160 [Symbiobacteriaceae bacterium]|nr:hypothetical protein [Symbiobacteriaceae bacterium]
MSVAQLRNAVSEAFDRRDYATCVRLLDDFLASAAGAERAHALRIKSSVLACDPRRAPEGLALVDEALGLVDGNPDLTAGCLTNALVLCWTMGDVHKAGQYEAQVHHLLQNHPENAGVKAQQLRIYGNLGLLANLRGQHAAAYWHFVRAIACAQSSGQTATEMRPFLFALYLYLAETCILMGRGPEATEALEKARPLADTEGDLLRWTIQQAYLLRHRHNYQEALALLDGVSFSEPALLPEDQTRFHLIRGLVAQDRGDLRSFHHHLSIAQRLAVEHALEFLLCEVQRAQRAPLRTTL